MVFSSTLLGVVTLFLNCLYNQNLNYLLMTSTSTCGEFFFIMGQLAVFMSIIHTLLQHTNNFPDYLAFAFHLYYCLISATYGITHKSVQYL